VRINAMCSEEFCLVAGAVECFLRQLDALAAPTGIPCLAVHFVIMGCGRAGAMLAQLLAERGHSVAIIDKDPEAFRRLAPKVEVRRVTGIGFDRDVLVQAGIEDAYAFAAVSNGDNSNILAARVVRETFGVRRVVARIYDPNRAEIYQRLGIPTVAIVRWTADQVLRRLLPVGATDEFTDSSGKVKLALVQIHEDWIGRTVRRFEAGTGARVAYLTRFGDGILPTPDTVIQAVDDVHIIVESDNLDAVTAAVAKKPVNE
jgi:trk system potassium uptake protein TrkA